MSAKSSDFSLEGAWRPSVAEALARLVEAARPGDYAVFDFDNTILCEDVGEATHAVLSQDGAFDRVLADELLSPPLLSSGRLASASSLGPVPYYEALAEAGDELSAYAWIVEALAGLDLARVVGATERTRAVSGEDREVSGPGFSVPKPFVRPELASLINALRGSGLEVNIVSASNVWSVRAMVRAALDPLLSEPFPLDRVFAVNSLLREEDGALSSDADLIRADASYRDLKEERLASLRLTARLVHPMPGFEGKVAVIRRFLHPERRPLLAAGDSLNDLSMLRYAEHRLLFARLNNPGLQDALRAALGADAQKQDERWLVQPVSQGRDGRLRSGAEDLDGLDEASVAAWSAWGLV